MHFKDYLINCGIKPGDDIIVHSSYKSVRNEFKIPVDDVIDSLIESVSPNGSLIMPAFTYSFKVKFGTAEPFYRDFTRSKTGAIPEVFRKRSDVIRTSSPTHSFSLFGNVTNFFDEDNAPESPLGSGSIMEWIANRQTGSILLLGVDFNSLSFGHYLEIAAKIPWFDFSPWDYMSVESIGLAANRFTPLKEIPGCSKQFVKFREFLESKNLAKPVYYNSLKSYYLKTELLYNEGLNYFSNNYKTLLCPAGTCNACDSRRKAFTRILNEI